MVKKHDITAKTIRDLLVARYQQPEWFLRFEVSNGTGGHFRGNADAVAMNMWPSRGLVLHGFEIKVSRSDWLNELKNPRKSERFMEHVDYWWLVAPPHVALDSEIPPKWGWIKATPKRLRIHKDAPPLFEPGDEKSIDRIFVAALVRQGAANDWLFKETVERAVKSVTDRQLKHTAKELEQLREYQKAFADTLGISSFRHWDKRNASEDAERLKAARRFLDIADGYSLDSIVSSAEHILDSAKKLRRQFREKDSA